MNSTNIGRLLAVVVVLGVLFVTGELDIAGHLQSVKQVTCERYAKGRRTHAVAFADETYRWKILMKWAKDNGGGWRPSYVEKSSDPFTQCWGKNGDVEIVTLVFASGSTIFRIGGDKYYKALAAAEYAVLNKEIFGVGDATVGDAPRLKGVPTYRLVTP